MAKDLVFEIGAEEIPADEVVSALEQLRESAGKAFAKERLQYKQIKTQGTPRRLVLLVTGLKEEQEQISTDVRGPSKTIAFTNDGKPTKAALGFARSQGVNAKDLEVRTTPQGSYVFAVKTIAAKKTVAILPDLLRNITLSLKFRKSMRWGDGDLRFARPIRWLMVVYGSKTVKISLDDIPTGSYTYGHRALGKKAIRISNAADYTKTLAEYGVIVDQDRRRYLIEKNIRKVAEKVNGKPIINPAVLDEVVNLVESPHEIIGGFDKRFLKLPRCVTVIAMEEHQRYFPVESARRRLLPNFIVVHNGLKKYNKNITIGHERVLQARLADALFFFEEDTRIRLADRVDGLKGIVFQEKLGTVFDKTERVKKIGSYIGRRLDLDKETTKSVKRASQLAKTDLLTNMVREFPALQGLIGSEYAVIDKEDKAVALAIAEQYLPSSTDGQLPGSMVGNIVSIADKIDTIVGCFLAGLVPTGSEDPYALRRQAQGIVSIVYEDRLLLDLESMIKKSLALYGNSKKKLREVSDVIDELSVFFKQRLRFHMMNDGVRYDVADAVMESGLDNIVELIDRAKAINRELKTSVLQDILVGFERCYNLSINTKATSVDRKLFDSKEERDLLNQVDVADEIVVSCLESLDVRKALKALAKLRSTIDVFFDEVLVMDKNKSKQANRLALLKKTSLTYQRIADFSKVVQEGN